MVRAHAPRQVDRDGGGNVDYNEFAEGLKDDHGARREGFETAGMKAEGPATPPKSPADFSAAKEAMRRHIEGSVEGGAFEMLREFKAFRARSGAAGNSVSFAEFQHGLSHMGIDIPVRIGLGRIVAFYCRASTLYQIR
jgi:hypothetical protein